MNYVLLVRLAISAFAVSMVVLIIKAQLFLTKAKASGRLERHSIIRTMCWVVAGGLCAGIFGALAVISNIHEDPNAHLSAWGAAALLLGVMVAVAVLVAVGFVIEVAKLRASGLPYIHERTEESSSGFADDNDL